LIPDARSRPLIFPALNACGR